MNLAIDAGNTLTKIGIFEGATLTQKKVFTSLGEARDFIVDLHADNAILSSVVGESYPPELHQSISGRFLVLSPKLPLPLVNRYATPQTLGADRIAAACGAWSLFPGESSLAIDCGTCINYEHVNKEGHYLGGVISPGVAMRFRAMHSLTERLPLGSAIESAELTGTSTLECLESGVMNGTLEEIKGIIARYRHDDPGIRVILTGGDARFFEKPLKPFIFVAPELVLTGLNSILLHNVLN